MDSNSHILKDFFFRSKCMIFNVLISYLISLWSENVVCVILILQYLLNLVLWLSKWSIVVSVPCILEKNAFSLITECNILYKVNNGS